MVLLVSDEHVCNQLFHSRENVTSISISSRQPLSILHPPSLLLQPIPTQELPDTCIIRLSLRTLHRHQLVKVLIERRGLAGASCRRIGRTLTIDIMLISDIPKEPDLSLGHKHRDAERMDRCIAEALVVEPTAFVEPVKVSLVGFSPEEVQRADFEVGEELAVVVVAAVVRIEKPVEVGLGVDEIGVGVDEGACAGPERGKGASVVENVHVEAVFEVVGGHEAEDVVEDVAEEVNLD